MLIKRMFILHHGDLTDSTSLIRIIQQVKPDEIYNLAAQSHVAVSFEEPEYTANSDALGTLRILEAIRILGFEKQNIIRLLHLNFMVIPNKYPKMKKHHSILEALMVLQNYMHTGLLLIIEKLMIFLHVMEFYLTMNLL